MVLSDASLEEAAAGGHSLTQSVLSPQQIGLFKVQFTLRHQWPHLNYKPSGELTSYLQMSTMLTLAFVFVVLPAEHLKLLP